MLGLRSPSARAALPRVPITKQLELLVEAGFFHENIEFRPRKTFPEWFGAVRDSPGRQRGEHGMQLQFAHIDLVQRVRSGMIIRQIVGLFLICYQRRHAFEHEVKIDRKSTRLNSSHSQISYAVFCLKKKKKMTLTRYSSSTPASLAPTPWAQLRKPRGAALPCATSGSARALGIIIGLPTTTTSLHA